MSHIQLLIERNKNILQFSSKDLCKKAARELKSQGQLFSEYHNRTLHQLVFLSEGDARRASDLLNGEWKKDYQNTWV